MMGIFGPPNIEKMEARKDITGLVKALRYRRDWMVRKAAAWALGKLGDPHTIEPLSAAILNDENVDVQLAAMEAIGKITGKTMDAKRPRKTRKVKTPTSRLVALLCGKTRLGKTAPEKVRRLIEEGANVNVRDEYGNTPLLDAVNASSAEVVRVLLDAGADVDASDKYGNTPLHAAVSSYSEETAKMLLNAGADINARDKNGHTAIDAANTAISKLDPYFYEDSYEYRDDKSALSEVIMLLHTAT